MAFEFHEMSSTVTRDPAAAAEVLRKLAVDEKLTGDQIAERLGVKRRTLSRWMSKLRSSLGDKGLGFKLAEGRRKNPGVSRGSGRKSKQGKKAGDN